MKEFAASSSGRHGSFAPRTEGISWKSTRMHTSNGANADDALSDEAGDEDILEMISAQDSRMAQGRLLSMLDAAETICPERSGPARDVKWSMILPRAG